MTTVNVSYGGESTSRLDEKGRITVPRKMRETMEVLGHAVWYMTRGFDGCIFLFHRDEWQRIQKQIGKFASMNPRALHFRRLFFSGMAESRPDGQGRIAIPDHLREHAGIDREAVIIGVDQHLEVWNKDKWREYTQGKLGDYEDVATGLFLAMEPDTAETEKGGHANETRAN